MKMIQCAIFDSKAEQYGKLIPFPNEAVAERTFEYIVNDEQTEFFKNPEDYTLMALGEYDDETGTITNYEANRAIAAAITLKKETK